MNSYNRIEDFRQAVERAASLKAALETLGDAIARQNELPGMIGSCDYGPEAEWLREELAALGHPLALRIRHSQLQSELLRIQLVIGEQMRAALDAAGRLVTTAAGGPNAAQALPIARINLEQLAQHRNLPPSTGTPESRLTHLRAAWRDIDTAMASLDEIRFDARARAAVRIRP